MNIEQKDIKVSPEEMDKAIDVIIENMKLKGEEVKAIDYHEIVKKLGSMTEEDFKKKFKL